MSNLFELAERKPCLPNVWMPNEDSMCAANILSFYVRMCLINSFNIPAVLTVDNSVVDLETIEALYENVSILGSRLGHK